MDCYLDSEWSSVALRRAHNEYRGGIGPRDAVLAPVDELECEYERAGT